MLDRRPRLGPRAVKEQRQAVVEEVEEAHQGPVAVVALAIARIFSQMQRQGAIGPQEAEEALFEPGWKPLLLLERRQC